MHGFKFDVGKLKHLQMYICRANVIYGQGLLLNYWNYFTYFCDFLIDSSLVEFYVIVNS
uniref:Uncharacterized protein n=1 Tax=Nelumbo nucifera TaxID=4432 RepID=A0A822XNS9_NELNU|nr:TPA_asm: hypothetical protein HUJ06_020631 [Nelumbo nucifera]